MVLRRGRHSPSYPVTPGTGVIGWGLGTLVGGAGHLFAPLRLFTWSLHLAHSGRGLGGHPLGGAQGPGGRWQLHHPQDAGSSGCRAAARPSDLGMQHRAARPSGAPDRGARLAQTCMRALALPRIVGIFDRVPHRASVSLPINWAL